MGQINIETAVKRLREAWAKGEKAPLYVKYANELRPQPAFVYLDRDGNVSVDTGPFGGGVPTDVWHRRTLRWEVSPQVSGEHLVDFLASDETIRLLERVHVGHSIDWDGNNLVGSLSKDAQEAAEELGELLDEMECVDVWGADEFLEQSSLHEIWSNCSLDDAVQNLVAEAWEEGIYIHDEWGVRQVLLSKAEEVFNEDGPEALDRYHLEALTSDGRIK